MEKCKCTINSRNQFLGLVHEDENAYSKNFVRLCFISKL